MKFVFALIYPVRGAHKLFLHGNWWYLPVD